jgi:hypothetical protein
MTENGTLGGLLRPRAAAAFVLLCMVMGAVLGTQYIPRLTNHQGYFLVPVTDTVRVPVTQVLPRPEQRSRTVVIVVDGLRRDHAESMRSVKRLLVHGQCRVSDQGGYTVSRPVYALLSTGLEVDRTGARNNENTAPLAAESIWQVAREAGLTVSGHSHLPWFRELFPDGFDRFVHSRSHEEDVFQTPDLYDVNLFHPLYVDEAGHQHGAASTAYAQAVARADVEIGRLLDRLDLGRDQVILTADHGHRDAGGHGGAQPEINQVLACFAGPHVQRRTDRASFDGRSTAPTLALMLGLRFPRNMRAGDDALNQIFDVVAEDASNAGYLADRRAAVERFRAENAAALERMLGGAPGTWPRLYAREHGKQSSRALLVAVLGTLFLTFQLRGVARASGAASAALGSLVWLAMLVAALWLSHHVVLGDFDYTVINLRERYVPRAFAAVMLGGGFACAARVALDRRWGRLTSDLVTFSVLLCLMNLGHVLVYGWPLGFPLPDPAARYFPFFGAIAQVGMGILTLLATRMATREQGFGAS